MMKGGNLQGIFYFDPLLTVQAIIHINRIGDLFKTQKYMP